MEKNVQRNVVVIRLTPAWIMVLLGVMTMLITAANGYLVSRFAPVTVEEQLAQQQQSIAALTKAAVKETRDMSWVKQGVGEIASRFNIVIQTSGDPK